MRITKTMMFSNMYSDLNKIQTKLFKQQMQIASGRRILMPSDDPIGVNHALNTRTAIDKNEQFQRNINYAADWLELTESTLNQIYDLLTDVKIIAGKANSSTYSDSERHGFAMELSQKIEDLLQFSKTMYNGKYIFGGIQTKSEPFITSNEITNENFIAQIDTAVELNHVHIEQGSVVVTNLDGDVTYTEGIDYEINYEDGTITVIEGSMSDATDYLISYRTDSISTINSNPDGNSGTIRRQIGENITMDINVAGDDLFANEVNIFDMLIEMKNKIEQNNIDGITNIIDDVQNAMDHIVETNSEVGAKINRLSLTTDYLENELITLKDSQADEEEVDVTEAMTKFQSLNLAYQAALMTSSEIMKSNLLNFI